MKEEARKAESGRKKVSLMLQAVNPPSEAPRRNDSAIFIGAPASAVSQGAVEAHFIKLQLVAMSAFVRAELCRRAHRQSVAAIYCKPAFAACLGA